MKFWRAVQHVGEGYQHNQQVRMGLRDPPERNIRYQVKGSFLYPHWSKMKLDAMGEAVEGEILPSLSLNPLWLYHDWCVEYLTDNGWKTFTTDEDPTIDEGLAFAREGREGKTMWSHLLEDTRRL